MPELGLETAQTMAGLVYPRSMLLPELKKGGIVRIGLVQFVQVLLPSSPPFLESRAAVFVKGQLVLAGVAVNGSRHRPSGVASQRLHPFFGIDSGQHPA